MEDARPSERPKSFTLPSKSSCKRSKLRPGGGSRSSCSISKLSAGGGEGGNLGLEGTLLGTSTLERGGASFSEAASEGLCKGAGVGFSSNPLLAEGGIRAGSGSAEGAGPAASSGTTGSADDAAAAAGEDLRGSGRGCMPQSQAVKRRDDDRQRFVSRLRRVRQTQMRSSEYSRRWQLQKVDPSRDSKKDT